MEKYHKQDVAPIERENERDENYKSDNPQIDSSKTKYNYHMHTPDGSYTEFINKRITELNLSPRKDAVVMNSFVVGAYKAFFDGLSKLSQYNFFSECTKFFEESYGTENVISAVIHVDESTPHMHLNLVPITKDGRLCSKDLFDKPKLQQLQTDFYNAVGKRYGLERGREGSQAKHLSTAEFKAKKIIEQAEAIRQENQVYADALAEAKSGDILIFLSGESEIKNVYNALKYSSIAKKLDIYPLYSRLSKEAQSSVFNKTRRGLTKVVVATNIAETSITIDGITTVIDSGTAKNNYYNNFNNTSSLIEGQISKSNASQRTGRAGRTKNGVCYRLYSREDFEGRSEFPEAEIKRSDLSDVVLRSIDLGIKNAENFPFITPVSTSAIVSAYDTLFTLGAIDKKREITEMGKFMMRFPLSVRHARIVAESVYTYPGTLKKVLIAVSFISTRSPFILVTEENEQDIKKAQKKYRTSGGDFLAYLKIFEDWTSYYTSEEKKHFADKHFLDYESMCEIECIERQLEDILSESGIPISDSCTLTEYMLCLSSGLKQYIIKGIGKGLYVGLQGNRVVISPSSMLIKGDYEYLVASEISCTNRLFARGVSPLKAEWISFIGDDVQKAFYTSLKSKPKKNAVQEKKSKKKKSEKKRKKSKKRK